MSLSEIREALFAQATALSKLLCTVPEHNADELAQEVIAHLLARSDRGRDPARLASIAPSLTGAKRDAISIDDWGKENPEIDELERDKHAFAQALRARMRAAGFKQRTLAERLGLTQSCIAQFASGRHKPQTETLQKLADVLGCSVGDLWAAKPQAMEASPRRDRLASHRVAVVRDSYPGSQGNKATPYECEGCASESNPYKPARLRKAQSSGRGHGTDPFELTWRQLFLAQQGDPTARESTRDAIRAAITYHAAQAASVVEGIDAMTVEAHVRERIGWNAEPEPDESILTATDVLIAYETHVDGDKSVNGLLREYARQFVADQTKGRELPRKRATRRVRDVAQRGRNGGRHLMEISDGFLTDAYGDPMGINTLYELSSEVLTMYARMFGAKFGVDESEILARVLDRIRVGKVLGVVTIVDQVQSRDGKGKRITIDRDIVAGALKADQPGRAFTAYLRNLVREAARSLLRRAERTRRVALTQGDEAIEEPDTSDEDVEWLRAEITRMPANVRRAITEYYLRVGTQTDVAKRLGITRDQLQALLSRGRAALRRHHEDLMNGNASSAESVDG